MAGPSSASVVARHSIYLARTWWTGAFRSLPEQSSSLLILNCVSPPDIIKPPRPLLPQAGAVFARELLISQRAVDHPRSFSTLSIVLCCDRPALLSLRGDQHED